MAAGPGCGHRPTGSRRGARSPVSPPAPYALGRAGRESAPARTARMNSASTVLLLIHNFGRLATAPLRRRRADKTRSPRTPRRSSTPVSLRADPLESLSPCRLPPLAAWYFYVAAWAPSCHRRAVRQPDFPAAAPVPRKVARRTHNRNFPAIPPGRDGSGLTDRSAIGTFRPLPRGACGDG